MQFLNHNLARDPGDKFPMVPGLLTTTRHEFGGGSSRQDTTTTVTRPQPPPAPAPLAVKSATQSVTDILTGRRRIGGGPGRTTLTRDSRDTYSSAGKRTILGTPIS